MTKSTQEIARIIGQIDRLLAEIGVERIDDDLIYTLKVFVQRDATVQLCEASVVCAPGSAPVPGRTFTYRCLGFGQWRPSVDAALHRRSSTCVLGMSWFGQPAARTSRRSSNSHRKRR